VLMASAGSGGDAHATIVRQRRAPCQAKWPDVRWASVAA
jgi:hypothetical protein